MSYCSPSKKKNDDYTCFTYKDLILIASEYNKKISKYEYPINTKQNKYDLWVSLYKKIKKKYDKDEEYKWLELDFLKNIDHLQKLTFKPKITYNWFNTKNINEIMIQYQEKYKDKEYLYLGTVPSDYYKFNSFDKLNIKKYKYFGIIFNTDTHDKPGEHWVSIYIDNENKTIEYFDSLGEQPNKNIKMFLNIFQKYHCKVNKYEHQIIGNNCGTYACYFIIKKLKGETFEEINSKDLRNKVMIKFKKTLFRPK